MDRHSKEEVIDISRDKVLVSAGDLQRALRRLSFLLNASPSPSLCRRLMDPIVIELWAISSWLGAEAPLKSKYCDVAGDLLRTLLKISSAPEKAEVLIRNALYNGEVVNDSVIWKYQLSGVDVLEIVVPRSAERAPQIQDLDWSEVEQKTSMLATTLVEGCTDQELSTLFLQLFKRWVSSKTRSTETIKIRDEGAQEKNPVKGLLEMMVLQQLMEKATEKLISKGDQLLDLTAEVLEADSREPQGIEIISVTLSILNHVISAPHFQKKSLKPGVLQLIESSLERISRAESPEVAQTARNLLMLLQYRDE
ncbi:hypothetical protein IMZ48_18910, partial [Candidatus Bathyarchaeota archaeon]|nr:hypothetical protein [Candidatus Bathyarchaeota archaeon]